MIYFGNLIKSHESFPEVFWKLKRKTEQLGLAKIKARDLPLAKDNISINDIEAVKQFFNKGVYEVVDYTNRDYYLKGQHWKTDDNQRQIRAWKYFCKRVWMTEDFMKKGKLDHPICVYWQPDICADHKPEMRLDHDDYTGYIPDVEKGKWCVSNGFGRAQFLGFHSDWEEEIEVVAFNTFAKSLEYEKIFTEDEDLLNVYGEGYRLNISLNWGTAVPYVNASVASKVNEISSDYHRKIHNWFKTTIITSNIKLATFNLAPPNSFHRRKIKGTVHLELIPALTKKDENGKYKHPLFNYKMVKACQMLPLMDENNLFYAEEMFSLKYTPA
jgi:hypothetical protein